MNDSLKIAVLLMIFLIGSLLVPAAELNDATHLGRETIKLSETTPELLAKQSKLVEKLGAEEINKITKKSFFKAFDAERVEGLRKILNTMPEGIADEFTTGRAVKFLSNKDVVKGAEELLKFVDKSELDKLAGSLDEFEELADITGRISKRYGSLDEFYPALKTCLKTAEIGMASICTSDEIEKITSELKKLGHDINSVKGKFGSWVADLTLDGIKLKVIDVTKVQPEKLAQYIKGYGKNPFDSSTGSEQLLKVYKSDQIITKVGSESVNGMAVLKKGDAGSGWIHISVKRADGTHHSKEIRDALHLADEDFAVKDVIAEVLEKAKPANNPAHPDNFEFVHEISRGSFTEKILVAVRKSDGNVVTAYKVD